MRRAAAQRARRREPEAPPRRSRAPRPGRARAAAGRSDGSRPRGPVPERRRRRCRSASPAGEAMRAGAEPLEAVLAARKRCRQGAACRLRAACRPRPGARGRCAARSRCRACSSPCRARRRVPVASSRCCWAIPRSDGSVARRRFEFAGERGVRVAGPCCAGWEAGPEVRVPGPGRRSTLRAGPRRAARSLSRAVRGRRSPAPRRRRRVRVRRRATPAPAPARSEPVAEQAAAAAARERPARSRATAAAARRRSGPSAESRTGLSGPLGRKPPAEAAQRPDRMLDRSRADHRPHLRAGDEAALRADEQREPVAAS